MRRVYNLLIAAPAIDEAKSRQDLSKVLADLRSKRTWERQGWPRTKILDGVDPTFINHREHADRMLQGGDGFPAAKGIKAVTMEVNEGVAEIVIDGSREWDREPHDYRARIRFSNFSAISKLPETTWAEKARILLEDNVRVDCDCNAFRYFYRYNATRQGFALTYEHTPAKVRNPARRGTVCKHLEHALRNLGGSYAVIASAMKRNHVEESMDITQRIEQAIGESTPVDEGKMFNKRTGHADIDGFLDKLGYDGGMWRHGQTPKGRAYAIRQPVAAGKIAAVARSLGWRHNGKPTGKGSVYHAPSGKVHVYQPKFFPDMPVFHVHEDVTAEEAERISEASDIKDSNSLFGGHLHEDVAQFGVCDIIAGLIATCAKRGMSRTGDALRNAYTAASAEGAPAPLGQPAQPDDRILPAPKD